MKHQCPQIIELLVDYLEGELPEEQRSRLEQHFAGCPPCVAFLDTYRSTGEVCKKAIEKSMPASMEQSLLDFLKANCKC
jgi:anti-sigma factor RsiW